MNPQDLAKAGPAITKAGQQYGKQTPTALTVTVGAVFSIAAEREVRRIAANVAKIISNSRYRRIAPTSRSGRRC